MRFPRAGHTATLLADGKVLVTGGYNETGALASTELYDPGVDSWTVAASMIGARTFHAVTLLQDGQLLAVGGGDYVSLLSSAELYDPAKGTWRKTGSLHYARSRHSSTLLPGGQVLVVGGYGDDDEGAELYEPSTGSWLETGWLSDGRSQHTATLLPDGQVLVAGGEYDGEVQEVSRGSAELYDAAAGSWTRTGSMLPFAAGGPVLGRSGHTATLLPNGVVLTGGGRYFVGTLTHSKSEKYDPATGKWTWAEAMSVRREYHTATLLTGGQVLIVGGFNRGTQETFASAELYDLLGASGPGSPIQLTDLRILPDRSFQFSFTNMPGTIAVILATPNLTSSGDWSLVGEATESSPGRYVFIDAQATNHLSRFYRVQLP